MELFIIGLIFGVGAAKTKEVTKAVAKGYMTLADKTKSAADSLRGDMQDAIEEVRAEQDENTLLVSDSDMATESLALQEATSHPSVGGDTTISSASRTHSLEAMPMDIPITGAAATPMVVVSQGKKSGLNIMKGLAKGYIAVTEKTKNATASFREDMRDAIEEARYERNQEIQRKATADAYTPPLEMMEPVYPESNEVTTTEVSLEVDTPDTKPVAKKSTPAPANAAKKPAPAASTAKKEADKSALRSADKKSGSANGPTVHKASDKGQTNSKNHKSDAAGGAADVAVEAAELAVEIL